MIQQLGQEILVTVGEQQEISKIIGRGFSSFIAFFFCNLNGTNEDESFNVCVCVVISMTTIADQNDRWASYARPGSWNGKYSLFNQQL